MSAVPAGDVTAAAARDKDLARQAVATFLHITHVRRARRLLRIGIPAARHQGVTAVDCAVFCVPVLSHFPISAGRLRELKQRHPRGARAVEFRIGDGEDVLLRYDERESERMTAAEAVAFFRWTADARGFEMLVPRAILAREISSILTISQVTAWRFCRAAARRFSRGRSDKSRGSLYSAERLDAM
jgi:hypothetical protein